jgi:multidrug efflux system membrane fusion protein
MNARWIFLPVALACGCQVGGATERAVRPVRVEAVKERAADKSLRFTGNVEPRVRVDLAFKRGGYVADLLRVKDERGVMRAVQEGDLVKQGTVLARLREADYRVKLEQAKAQLAQAATARDQAKLDLDRAKQLLSTESIPQALFDGAQAKHRAGEAQADAAQAMVDEAGLALGDASLVAPMDAVVLKRLVEVGSLVGPGSGGFVLADTLSVKVVFGVPDTLLDRLPLSTVLRVNALGVPDTVFEGRVSRIGASADLRSRLFDVEVTIPNQDGRLKPGMIASLSAPEEKAKATPVVPLSAVVRPPGATEGFAVFVAEGKDDRAILRARRVEVGELFGSQVEIMQGLAAGERVVVVGASFAFDGESVALR